MSQRVMNVSPQKQTPRADLHHRHCSRRWPSENRALSSPLRVVSSSHEFRHSCTPYRTSIYFVTWIALNFPISSYRVCWLVALEEFHKSIQRISLDTPSHCWRERATVWTPDGFFHMDWCRSSIASIACISRKSLVNRRRALTKLIPSYTIAR